MTNSVIRLKIINRRNRINYLINNLINFFLSPIRKENRLCIGLEGLYMPYTIIFFGSTGKLVFLDFPFVILFKITASNQPRLAASIHSKTINIKVWHQVCDKGAFGNHF